jgi:hypothetical protein
MINIRKSLDRGHGDHGWLDSRHTFSFAGYFDPKQMGFRTLRVINEDRVQPKMGFGMHDHQDMEIFSYVLEGALEHKDSMGNGSVLRPGEIQIMSAGTGILHSEFNPSDVAGVHFYQIWILPERKGLTPRYDQKMFAKEENRMCLVVSHDGRDGSLVIHQDADIYLANLAGPISVSHNLAPARHAWVQVLKGSIELSGEPMSEGDGAGISNEPTLDIQTKGTAEIMLFDLG